MLGIGQIRDGSQVIFNFFARQTQDGDEGGWFALISTRPRGRPDTFVAAGIEHVVFAGAVVQLSGSGWWNGRPGYTFVAEAADLGHPGRGTDTFSVTVRDPDGLEVLRAGGALSAGSVK